MKINNVYNTYDSPFGRIVIVSDGSAVINIKLENNLIPDCKKGPDAVTDLTSKQLEEYFNRKRYKFDVPLAPKGTVFQQSVWSALQEIPCGETRTYKQIAEKINNPKACRAVGLANNRNPIWILIPCHRVVGSDGGLTGYAGGLEMKQKLLELESWI